MGADAGQTKFVIRDFPDQQEIGLYMAFHLTGPDADKRMWATPFGKRVICLQQRNHHPKGGTVIGGKGFEVFLETRTCNQLPWFSPRHQEGLPGCLH